jgi:hypothetical protein
VENGNVRMSIWVRSKIRFSELPDNPLGPEHIFTIHDNHTSMIAPLSTLCYHKFDSLGGTNIGVRSMINFGKDSSIYTVS